MDAITIHTMSVRYKNLGDLSHLNRALLYLMLRAFSTIE